MIDKFISSTEERFQALKTFHFNFELLFHVMDENYMSQLLENDIQALCLKVAKVVGFEETVGLELFEEAKSFSTFPNKADFLRKHNACDTLVSCNLTSALAALIYLVEAKVVECYPTFYVALRAFLTIPVTVASAERSFSKLKLIKTFLRSTMSQSKLSSLAVISIERDIGRAISYDDLIADFAQKKARLFSVC